MSLGKLMAFLVFVWGNVLFLFLNTTHHLGIDILFLCFFFVLCAALFKHLRNPLDIAISSYLVFNYLFFYIAPLIQMHSYTGDSWSFPNTMPFRYYEVCMGIISIIVFNVIFFLCYYRLERGRVTYKPGFIAKPKEECADIHKYRIAAFVMLGLSVISLVFAANEFANRTQILAAEETSKIKDLIISKVILFLPLFPAIYYARFLKKNHWFGLIAAAILLIACKNPFIEKRNALGPIYLTLIMFLLPKLMSTNARSLKFLSVILIILFPLMAILTHNKKAELSELISGSQQEQYMEVITNTFSELHYDAFSNVVAAISYSDKIGATYGKQLVGSILFFVPRSIWAGKPWGSGQEIGEYLTNNYRMWFTNLSMPLVGEGWMNFGFIGVVFFAILLAFVINYFKKWFYSGNLTKQIAAVYFSFHLIFLLRGDLMNGVAYFIGPFFAFFIIPNIIARISSPKRI